MGRGTRNKSSASAGTRKKQAAKAAAKTGGALAGAPPAGHGPDGTKLSKKERQLAKKRSYVPPARPPQPAPNPLDSMGLASLLPADLVVLLRRVLKKDIVTRVRALEALLAWVHGAHPAADETEAQRSDSDRVSALVMMLPFWTHIFPRLALSPSQRLRLCTLQVHAELLHLPACGGVSVAEELLSPVFLEPIIAFWALLSYDTGRPVARLARRLWGESMEGRAAGEHAAGERAGRGTGGGRQADSGRSHGAEPIRDAPATAYLGAILDQLRPILLTDTPSATLAQTTPSLQMGTAPAQPTADPPTGAAPASASTELDAKSRDDENVDENADEVDRRLVAGALGVLQWTLSASADTAAADVEPFAADAHVWTALCSEEHAAEPARGEDAPAVRQRGWAFLGALNRTFPELVDAHLDEIMPPAFAGAWAERDVAVIGEMLSALLPVLRRRPDAWLSGAEKREVDDSGAEDSGAEDSGTEGSGAEESGHHGTPGTRASGVSTPYTACVAWLQAVGPMHPQQCFPAVLVLVSTLPRAILPPTPEAASSFLEPLRALPAMLSRSSSMDTLGWDAYVAMLCECTRFLLLRVVRAEGPREMLPAFVCAQLEDIWRDLVVRTALPERARARAAMELGTALATVEAAGGGAPPLSDAFLALVADDIAALHAPPGGGAAPADRWAAAPLLVLFLRTASDAARAQSQTRLQGDVAQLARTLLHTLASASVQAAETEEVPPARAATAVAALASLLQSGVVGGTADAGGALDAGGGDVLRRLVIEHVPPLVGDGRLAPEPAAHLVAAYVHAAPEAAADVWGAALRCSARVDGASLAFLCALEEALPASAPPTDMLARWRASLIAHAGSAVERAEADAMDTPAAMRLPAALLDDDTKQRLVEATLACSTEDAAFALLCAWHAACPHACVARLVAGAPPRAVLALVFRRACMPDAPAAGSEPARTLWRALRGAQDTRVLDDVAAEMLQTQLLAGTTPAARTLAVAASLEDEQEMEPGTCVRAILPDRAQLDAALAVAAAAGCVVDAAATDTLAAIAPAHAAPAAADVLPLSRAADAYVAALHARHVSMDDVAWTLPHLVFVAMLLEDALLRGDAELGDALVGLAERGAWDAEPGAWAAEPGAWDAAAQKKLVDLVHLATRIVVLYTAALPVDWHASTARRLGVGGAPREEAGTQDAGTPDAAGRATPLPAARAAPLTDALAACWTAAATSDDPHARTQYARLFSRVLAGALSMSSVSGTDAEHWVRLAQSVQKMAPTELVAGVLAATRQQASATRADDRWRNELAAALSGVPSARAASEGRRYVQMLVCAAPPEHLGVPLVPTQRAMFLLQTVQRWLASEDELDDLYTPLAALLTHIAPVVLARPGTHLDMMLDVVLENLAALELKQPAGWLALLATLRLLDALDVLRAGAPHLDALFRERAAELVDALHGVLLALCAYAVQQPAAAPPGELRSVCVALAVRLVVDYVPAAALAGDVPALATTLTAPTAYTALQLACLRLYRAVTHERVHAQVVELSVATARDAAATALEPALVRRLHVMPAPRADVWDDGEARRGAFAFLLAWLALLDHLDGASLALKTAFVHELQRTRAVSEQLLPGVFVLIGGAPRGERGPRALDPTRSALDAVHLDDMRADDVRALQALAGHVYFSVLVQLPTPARDWFLGIRDRQLALFVRHFTSRFCSPLLAERELSHLRDPHALAHLQDEAMAVKVLSSNEVVATYTVDEHPMEIGVRLPPDYPLRGVEIRDIKRVGVSEAQWRAWLLAVQQLLSGRNGLIIDALTLFKRNAETKFQGYEGAECAICYSIISPTDQTLPTKPCRTCKHRFHGSCLFKWVSTSGQSTCPLCRSVL
ncbi:hypothetical protein MSPP1_001034 [Malassezia sp. CBS 17886]|nr:hypothetical protein MSPP1_001034 [Malassezia sp. CBS 17886]